MVQKVHPHISQETNVKEPQVASTPAVTPDSVFLHRVPLNGYYEKLDSKFRAKKLPGQFSSNSVILIWDCSSPLHIRQNIFREK